MNYADAGSIAKFSESQGDDNLNSLKGKFIQEVVDFCLLSCVNCGDNVVAKGDLFNYDYVCQGGTFDMHSEGILLWFGGKQGVFKFKVAQNETNERLLKTDYNDRRQIRELIGQFFLNNGIDLERRLVSKDEFFGFYNALIQFVSYNIVRVVAQIPPYNSLSSSLDTPFQTGAAYFLYNNLSAPIKTAAIDMFTNTSKFKEILQTTIDNSRVFYLQYQITFEKNGEAQQ